MHVAPIKFLVTFAAKNKTEMNDSSFMQRKINNNNIILPLFNVVNVLS